MNRIPPYFHVAAQKPRGVALIMVLILLLIMTLLGLANLRGTLLEERMSANMLDRGLAFQSTEAALRAAEAILADRPTFPNEGCSNGLCAAPVGDVPDRSTDPNFQGWVTTQVNLGESGAVQPQYFVEFLGMAPKWPACDQEVPMSTLCLSPRYRISARSEGLDRASVILQSNYAAQ